jgi:hypothetical protein
LCWSIAREIASRFFASELVTASEHSALRRVAALISVARR